MQSASVQAMALEDRTNTKGVLEIHQETLVQGIIRIFLVVQGATTVGKKDTSWQIVGISREPPQGSTKPTIVAVKTCASVTLKAMASDPGCSDVPQEYKPFLSCGSICLHNSSIETPIMILRDTGANQSLLLEGSLPLSEQISTGTDVLIQGVKE